MKFNGKPTEKEQKDLQTPFEQRGWVSADPQSCIASEEINSNQTIQRVGANDTNSIKDWQIVDDTPIQIINKNPEPTIIPTCLS